MKPLLTQDERNYILAGNYKLLDMVIASAEGKIQEANRKVLSIERKYIAGWRSGNSLGS